MLNFVIFLVTLHQETFGAKIKSCFNIFKLIVDI